jgi:hypothetical protein
MGEHDTPDDDMHDDWRDEWAQGQIANLEDALDDAYDDADYYDDSSEDSRALYDPAPAWWQRILQRVWWRWRWMIPLTALLVPLALLIGGMVVIGALSGDSGGEQSSEGAVGTEVTPSTTPVQNADWPPGLTFAPHTIPAMIRHDLPAAGAIHGYQFEGEAGDVWHITVEPDYDSTLDPMFRVYDPDGHLLAENDNRAPADPSAETLVVLPEDGAYRLVIQAAGDGLTTGTYWLMVNVE